MAAILSRRNFNWEYFVFGFLGLKKDDVLIGAYRKDTDDFILDYSNSLTSDVREDFLDGIISLPLVKLSGVGFESFQSLTSKDYVTRDSFFVDELSCSMKDEESQGYIVIPNGGVLDLELGEKGRFVWSTGKVFEKCSAFFDYNEFLGIIDIKILLLDVVRVVEKSEG